MILSKCAGARFQMDLVQMPKFNNYNYILSIVDHLSKYGFVFPFKRHTAQEVGDELLHILATSVGPRILQSDNGSEFFGYCDLINETFPWMHIVRGKPRKPSTQGSVEVSHRVFKAALVKGLDKENTDNWVIGASVIQCEVNHYPMRSRSGMSPHTIYYGKPPTASYSVLLGGAYKKACIEYGLRLAKRLLLQIKQMKPEMVIPQQQVEEWVLIGDEVWSMTTDDPDVDSEELLVVAFHECLVKAGITMEDGTEIVEDKYDSDTLPSDEERYDMEVQEIDHNPFWDNKYAHFTAVERVAQASDSAGAIAPFLSDLHNEDAHFTAVESVAQVRYSAGATATLLSNWHTEDTHFSAVDRGPQVSDLVGATAPFLKNFHKEDAHIESVEEVEQVSDLAGVKEPILNNLKNEDAYTTSLVVLAQASDSGVMTEPLFTKALYSGLTAGEEIHLDGRTVPSENHDVGREAFLPQMDQTEATEPMLVDGTSSKEAAEVFHGESIK
jgi:hypothetical protein